VGVRHGDAQLTPPGLTTPDAGDAARLLADLHGRGVTHLAVEASSHGIDQRRLDGVNLSAAGFTNLTQDHLDYHGDMDAYRAAKLRLFETLLPRGRPAGLNADSPAFAVFAQAAIGCGHGDPVGGRSAAKACGLSAASPRPEGSTSDRGGGSAVRPSPCPGGRLSGDNALVAAGLCIAAGEALEPVLGALSTLEGAVGRLQRVGDGRRARFYVDYAHTPDGLETALAALRPHATGRLIVVFGAGGDRDRAKRPLMGAAAARGADVAIVTDDNPRSERPEAIRTEVLAGAQAVNRRAREIGDRRRAIREAVAMLRPGDVLVIAGKGHDAGADDRVRDPAVRRRG
jgi:UDP-N-acetylmuramoyl-L-alanyl-D-glutamate--2,6-diaminopimelate ligase